MFRIAAKRFALVAGLLAVLAVAGVRAEDRPWVWADAEFPEVEKIHLSPLIGHPDEALARALMAEKIAWLKRQFKGYYSDGERKRSMPAFDSPDFPFTDVFVGRVSFAPVGHTQFVILMGYEEARFSPFGLEAWVFEPDGAGWRFADDISGFRDGEDAFFYLTVGPAHARLYGEHMELINRLFIVPSIVDGYRTVIWGESGQFWTGKDWRYFCWSTRCD